MDFNNKEYTSELIRSAKNIAILCRNSGTGNSHSDCVAAGVAVAEYIEDEFSVVPTVIYPYDLSKIDIDLLEIRNVFTDFQPKVLKVTLDFNGTSIESVDYHKGEGNQLVLEMRPIGRDFNTDRIKYDIDGIEYDLIITIGGKSLESFGDVYSNNKEEIEKATIINIDNSRNNNNYGTINIIDSEADSLSVLIFKKFAEWGYSPSKEAAKSLLIGMSVNGEDSPIGKG